MSGPLAATLPAFERLRSIGERVWDRIDRALLRLQGRVDTPSYDRWLPYGFAVLHAALLIVLVLARYNQLDHGLETAKYAQAMWQIGEDLRPVTTLSGGNLLAEQGSLILYPLGLLTSVLPRIETLLVIKSIALAVTAIPLWRLARRHGLLGIGATSAVVFAYSIYTYVHNMNIADFAPAVLAVPALMFAVLAGFDEKKRVMAIAMVFALCCRADLGLAIAGLGVLLLIERKRRVGTMALLLGAGWFLVAVYGIQRGLGDGSYEFLAPYRQFGDTPMTALWGIISHPIEFAKTVGTLANFQILVTLLAPVVFLPLTAPRYLMPAVPLYVLYMGADVPFGRLREAAQTVPMTVFVFVATVFALKGTGRILVKRVRVERRIILAILVTALVFFVRDSTTSPYSEPWQWGGRDSADLALVEATAIVPVDEPVRASSAALPLMAERLGVYNLNLQAGAFDGSVDESGELIRIPFGDRINTVIDDMTTNVDWLILDRADFAGISGDDFGRLRGLLAGRGWQIVNSNVGDDVEIYTFTGIIGAVPLAQDAEVDFALLDQEDDDG